MCIRDRPNIGESFPSLRVRSLDAPTTFAWTKPVVAPARWCRLECFGLDVRIKQPHGRFEMSQIGAMLIGLSLKTFDRVGDFQSLVAQGRDNQHRGHGGSRARLMTSGEHSGSRTPPVEEAGGGCYIRPVSYTHLFIHKRSFEKPASYSDACKLRSYDLHTINRVFGRTALR